MQHVQEVNVPKISLSDHYPVCLTWKKHAYMNSHEKMITYRDFSKFQNDNFINDLNRFMPLLNDNVTVNEAVNSLSETFVSVLDDHAVKNKNELKTEYNQFGSIQKLKKL